MEHEIDDDTNCIGTLGTIIKRILVLELEDFEIRGQVENTQTIALLRSVRILRKVVETCSHLDSREIPSTTANKNTIEQITENCL